MMSKHSCYFIKRNFKLLLVILIIISIFCININVSAVNNLNVGGKAYVLIEKSTGSIISGNNYEQKLPMASTTKIMTALIVLQQKDLDKEFIVDSNAIMVEGSSMGLVKGDKVSLRDLAYGILIVSGNDAANAAAVRISGSIEKFVKLMNQKAKEFGLKNTLFKNPSGLPDEEHYTTAYELAIITSKALENKEFSKICSTKQAKLEYGNPPYTRYLTNHNKLLWNYEGCIGVKTGFTKEAGRCLVSAATKDNQTLICVTLNTPNDWATHATILNYGFKNNKPSIYIPKETKVDITLVGSTDKYQGYTKNIINTFVNQNEHKNITQEFFYRPFYYNLKTDEKIGYVIYKYKDKVIASEDLLAIKIE